MPSRDDLILQLITQGNQALESRLDKQDKATADFRKEMLDTLGMMRRDVETKHLENANTNTGMQKQIDALKIEVGSVKGELNQAKTFGRWMFACVMALGGFITWALGVWSKVSAIVKG